MTDDKWLTPTKPGTGEKGTTKLSEIAAKHPSVGDSELFVNVDELLTFSFDIAELALEFGTSLKQGVLNPMTGGAGTLPSSGLLYHSSVFADKYSYAMSCVSKMFGWHANGLMATYAMGTNAAIGYMNGDHDGGRNIKALTGEGAPADKLMFKPDGSPVKPPPDAQKEALNKQQTETAVKDILRSQSDQAKPKQDGDGKPKAPNNSGLVVKEGFKPPETPARGEVLAGGRPNAHAPFNGDIGLRIEADDERIEVNLGPPKK